MQGPHTPPLVIGIDAGGTKTEAVLADGQGEVIARARRGGANLAAHGELEVEKTLHELIEEVLGDGPARPDVICLGIAGVDRPDDSAIIHGIMRRIGARARLLVTNDALIALVAGAGVGPGVVVIAGTGSIAYGRNARNEAARAGGWGYILADEGSGFWIGRQALRAVVRAADGRGPATALTPLVLDFFGVSRAEQLVREVYRTYLKPSDIARCARLVQQAREGGDAVAAHIASVAADELSAAVRSVVRQLELDGGFPVVMAGGAFHAVPWLQDALRARLAEASIAPAAQVHLLTTDPALGAVRLALAEARGGASIPTYKTRDHLAL
ncbi:Glucosamine kinase GspK [Luteitalea pratensis]|uniref:Glucosamine kinase GspK n=1 Tax=Luteitalea pratensis TaxID=1855912 RepID=A0A143PNN3_LUTPR|nr:BadF/BadG/BcrA/BcrD ATPase family protein [Luteitalea pratensis]AMY10257.1 Glucosamine kinase GspK [Luteitalea pratensis]